MYTHWLISYDITDDRTRLKVAQLLLDYGERVQESVYELRLHPGDWQRLNRRLNRMIDREHDEWRAWSLCAADRHDAIELGQKSSHPAEHAIIV